LNYNELKLQILQVLSVTGPADSNRLAKAFAESKGITVDIHALRMALMRYHEQGLLRRERAEGMFRYTLTQRGLKRLRWLEEQSAGLKP
jgi:DNA-binding transcriptional regulator PaaX